MNSDLLTMATINILTPRHDRTSCNDQTNNNCYRNDDGYPDCARCYLLWRMDMGETLSQVLERVEITVTIGPKHTTETVEVKKVIPD